MINLGDGLYILKTKFGFYLIAKVDRREWQVAFFGVSRLTMLKATQEFLSGKGVPFLDNVQNVGASFREIRSNCLKGKYQRIEVPHGQQTFITE